MRQALEPHVFESSGTFLRVPVGDGEAGVYLRDEAIVPLDRPT